MKRFLPALFLLLLLDACTSGKAALKQGNYYEAVVESVNRLRSSPDNKKAKAVLQQGYPLAIEYIDTNIKNGIDADDPMKWRNAVNGYNQINALSDQINTSMGAKKIISKPATRYAELKDAKRNAAEESYQAGIASMMKNTRDDAKQAYFDFKASAAYEPGYKETMEMMNQAEFNATLRVAYDEINTSTFNYGSVQPVVNSLKRQFLSFRPLSQKDTVPPHQILRMVYKGYNADVPRTTTRTDEVTKEVKIGEKKDAAGKTIDIMETVNAKVTTYRKERRASSTMMVTITDVSTGAVLKNESVIGNGTWVYEWATYSGDGRALSTNQLNLSRAKEAFPNNQDQFDRSVSDMSAGLKVQLVNFYSRY